MEIVKESMKNMPKMMQKMGPSPEKAKNEELDCAPIGAIVTGQKSI